MSTFDFDYSDTEDSSPSTIRRKPPPSNNIIMESDKVLSSKDFLPTSGSKDSVMEKEAGQRLSSKGRPPSAPKKGQLKELSQNSQDDDGEDDEDEFDDETANMARIEGIYNADDYANLNVAADIKEIFTYIAQYALPSLNSMNDVKLHPFIPDYYPSVGDIDAFIKVAESGVKEDGLGVKVLDEPAPFQSDPSVLDLRLRALAKQSSAKSVVVKKVENVGKNSKIIDNWIKDISDLHRSKPSPSVHYSKPMPDIDLLLQEWPPETEEMLKDLQLPSPDLNCDLQSYVDMVCNLLDIPVYKSRVQSLHVLFTLYTTHKQFSNQFMSNGGGLNPDADLMPTTNTFRMIDEDDDHLQLS